MIESDASLALNRHDGDRRIEKMIVPQAAEDRVTGCRVPAFADRLVVPVLDLSTRN
jgi:hypothetical protein